MSNLLINKIIILPLKFNSINLISKSILKTTTIKNNLKFDTSNSNLLSLSFSPNRPFNRSFSNSSRILTNNQVSLNSP